MNKQSVLAKHRDLKVREEVLMLKLHLIGETKTYLSKASFPINFEQYSAQTKHEIISFANILSANISNKIQHLENSVQQELNANQEAIKSCKAQEKNFDMQETLKDLFDNGIAIDDMIDSPDDWGEVQQICIEYMQNTQRTLKQLIQEEEDEHNRPIDK